MRTGILVGSGWLKSDFLKNLTLHHIETAYGKVEYWQKGNLVFVQRHSMLIVPPHKINHKANIQALKQLHVERIIGINSTGSLKLRIRPGTLVIPNDYMTFCSPPTFYDEGFHFTTPGLDKDVETYLEDATRRAGVRARAKGVYIQMHGPRFETRAEVKVISQWADIVGMTLASEASLANEFTIPYASICSVDNYAHGMKKKPMTQKSVEDAQVKNLKKLEKVLNIILQDHGM